MYDHQCAHLTQQALLPLHKQISVASAVHDSIDDAVAEKWLGRPKGNSTGGGSSSGANSAGSSRGMSALDSSVRQGGCASLLLAQH